MISASHNPYEDNGIKIFARDGYKLPDEREAEIETLMESEEVRLFRPTGDQIGRAFRISDAGGRYNVMAKSAFPRRLTLSGLKIVIDCAHGAAYKVAPEVLRELGADVIAVGIQPNGVNINEQCGATYPQAVQIEVLHHQADLGISLDGDADRCILVDERGMVLDGDQILAVLARHLHQKGKLNDRRVVTTIMSNLGLEAALHPLGIQVDRVQVGDRYVVARMREHDLSLGGEQSGHTILHQYTTTGDGLVTALSMLSVMVEEKKKLSDLAQEMTPFPQVLKSMIVPCKPPLTELHQTQALITQVEDDLTDQGRVLVRYSGTQKMVRVMIEGPDTTQIQGYVDQISTCLLNEIESFNS
jgi:phosphoglucosamine mutase